jgi:hypothetical protein
VKAGAGALRGVPLALVFGAVLVPMLGAPGGELVAAVADCAACAARGAADCDGVGVVVPDTDTVVALPVPHPLSAKTPAKAASGAARIAIGILTRACFAVPRAHPCSWAGISGRLQPARPPLA